MWKILVPVCIIYVLYYNWKDLDSGFDEADFNFDAIQEEPLGNREESSGNEKQLASKNNRTRNNNTGKPKKVRARRHLEIEYDNSQRERDVNEDS